MVRSYTKLDGDGCYEAPVTRGLVLVDSMLTCSSCNQVFTFSAGEQELLHLRGISRTPKQCPVCARRSGRRGAL
jgi:Probable zinc-ribbon domain